VLICDGELCVELLLATAISAALATELPSGSLFHSLSLFKSKACGPEVPTLTVTRKEPTSKTSMQRDIEMVSHLTNDRLEPSQSFLDILDSQFKPLNLTQIDVMCKYLPAFNPGHGTTAQLRDHSIAFAHIIQETFCNISENHPRRPLKLLICILPDRIALYCRLLRLI